MGACYSKNVDAGPTSPDKAPRQKLRDSKKNKRRSTQESISPETVPLTKSQSSAERKDEVEVSAPQIETHRSSTPDLIPEHFDQKIAERGVAPSDSGIESIGTPHEDVHENTQSKQERDELSKRLERLSRGSCHKCGNFKLDDTALTALLADTYCLCGPRQAGKPSVNPQCQTHGAQRNKRSVSTLEFSTNDNSARQQTNGAQGSAISCSENRISDSCNDVTDSGLKSSLKKPDSVKRDKSLRISGRSVESLDLALTLLSSVESGKGDFSEIFIEDKTYVQAPLAMFDSVDTILNDSPLHKNEKRRSLLSEILDITDSICKCDFYSNEYCCPRDHSANTTLSEEGHETDGSKSNTTSSTLENGSTQMNHVNGDNTLSNPNENSDNPTESSSQCGIVSRNSSQRLSLISKKSSSLPKNVSFANEKDMNPESLSKSKDSHHGRQESSISEASSGFYTQNSASESFLANESRDLHKRSASLGSGGGLMSDTSSEAPEYVTEDDLNSLDLDSLSRVTSLSYSSIRQLVESTEDLVSPLDTARRMTVDGVDCVVIPTETYRQMQSDLALLKQQLICLSALIQEEAENLERSQGDGANASFVFDS